MKKKKYVGADFEVLIGNDKPLTKKEKEDADEALRTLRAYQKKIWDARTDEEKERIINTTRRLQNKYKLEDEIELWLQKL